MIMDSFNKKMLINIQNPVCKKVNKKQYKTNNQNNK